MKPSASNDADASLREALQRDAARVPEPAFDAALHQETMRRLRGLEGKPQTAGWWRPAFQMAAAAVMVIGISAALRLRMPHPASKPEPDSPVAVAVTAPAEAFPRSSMLRYEAAARAGDAALLAALNRDSTVLLPPSPAIFAAPLP